MEILILIGAGLCFSGLVLGALSGSILLMLAPIGAGMLLFGVAGLWQHAINKQAASWRATYPSYKY